jgi:type I restriction enzyme S subunit
MKKGWETKTLGEICEVFADGDWVESKDQSSEGIRLIQTGNVGEGVFKDRAEKARYISEVTFKRLRCTEIFEGDCLLSRLPDPVGRSCILPDTGERMITAVDCTILRFNPKQLLPTFFNHYSQSDDYLTTVAKECTGTTRNRISRSNLGLTPIPVPPLSEQQRIVGLLDEAFAGIATAKANAEKNLQNARALFESHLHDVFSKRGEGWQEKHFDEVCVLQRGFDLPTRSRNTGKFPLVSSNGITDEINLWKVKAPGVVTGRSGTIGNVHYIEKDFWPLNTALYVKDFHNNNPRFIFHFLRHFNLGKYSSGAGVPTLNRNNVHSVVVSIPTSSSEQKRILATLDSLQEETQRLARLYERKLAALDEMKKSLLHQAFNGEL